MKPNFTMLKVDGTLREADNACRELMTMGGLTALQYIVLTAVRIVRAMFKMTFTLPPERD